MSERMMDSLMQRLERLERENRRFKMIALAIASAVASIVVMGQAGRAKVPKVVEAEKFVLRDISGQIRGGLHITTEGEPSLSLITKNGQAQLIVGRFGPLLRLYDKNERVRLSISALALGENDRGAGLALFDENERERATMSVDKEKTSLRLSGNEKNYKSGEISLTSGGLGRSSSLVIWDGEGEIRSILDDSPTLNLYGKDGKRLLLGTTHPMEQKGYESSIILFDKDKRIIWKAQ